MILEGAGLGSWDWWLDSNQVHFDRLWCEMLGLDFTKTEMSLSTWQVRVHPDDLAQCFVEIKKYLNGETEYYENVHRMKHADGHWVYILDRGRISERDSSGKPIRFTGTHFDLTSQKRIEQNLLDYKRKNDTIFESSNDAIMLLDNGIFLETNRKGLEMFGYESLEEMRYLRPGDLSREFQPDGRNSREASQEILDFLKINNTHRFEWVHKKKNGETFEVDIVASTFELEGKRITQATIRDLSNERREQRRNLSFYNALLEMSNLDSRQDFMDKIHFILERVAQTLGCTQVGYWDYFDDEIAIKSLASYNRITKTFSSGVEIPYSSSPAYFKAILGSSSLVAHDVREHVGTKELVENYFLPNNIFSMMDHVVKNDEIVQGVLCLEQKDKPREWSVNEQAFSRAVADIISIILKDESLKKNQKVLEDVEAMARIGGWEFDLTSKSLSWTAETFRVHGLPVDTVLTVELAISFYTPENQKRIAENFERCVREGTSYRDEFEITSFDGLKKWIRTSGEAVRDRSGAIVAVRGVFQDTTETKNRELELSKTRDRLKRVVDSSPTVIYECLMKGDAFHTTYMSHQIQSLAGYPLESFFGKNDMVFSKLILPEDYPMCVDNLRQAIEGSGSYEYRFRLRTRQGEIRWVLDKGSINKKNGLMNGVLLDITHERALVQNLQNVKDAMNELAIIAITDTKGVITYVNKSFEQVSGYKSHELVGHTHRVINSGCHPPEFFEQLWATITAGQIWRGQIKNRSKNGEFYYVDTTIHPVKNESGEIVEYLGVRTEVTRKVREERINYFISSLRASFIELSEEPAQFYDKALSLLLELSESPFGFMAEILQEKNVPVIKMICASRESTMVDFESLKPLFHQVLLKFEPVVFNQSSASPSINSFACFPIQLSAHKRMVVSVANRSNGYFQDFADFLAPALTVLGEMVDAMKLKESLRLQMMISEHNAKLASIGQLAAGVGHEINNPLAIIKGILMMASEELESAGLLNESVGKKFTKIDVSIDRIANIVKGLKTFSRSGESELNQFDLRELMQEVQGFFQELYQRAGIDLQFDFDSQASLPVFGNRGRIQQVLVNLIANAKDATEGVAKPQLKVKMGTRGGRIQIEVSDNGHGIPKEISEKIFDPFFTTKDVNKGTGIGLSLVLTIIKEHAGDITFDSVLGKGTSFHFSLPMNTQREKSVEVVDAQPTIPVKEKLRVLVVDDEEDLRDILHQIFLRLGFEVVMACDGSEALSKLSQRRVDLVISDSKMPLMSGPDLLEKIKQLYGAAAPRFILVSGDLNLTENKFNDQVKPDDVLMKPFRIELIKSKIATLFPQILQ
jgi:PAS domain S-box-containing protein